MLLAPATRLDRVHSAHARYQAFPLESSHGGDPSGVELHKHGERSSKRQRQIESKRRREGERERGRERERERERERGERERER